MKIFKRENPKEYYFMQSKKLGLFDFRLKIPDMNTLELCACYLSKEEEEFAWDNGIEVPEELGRYFNSYVGKDGNYEGISSVIKSVLKVSQKEIDEVYGRDLELLEFVMTIAKEGSETELSKYEIEHLYFKVKQLLKTWNGDKERVKKYLIEHGDVGIKMFGKMIDIFDEDNPTKRKLLHDFDGLWGDELDGLIDEAVKKYPDENDFDKAFYYVRDYFKNKKKEKTADEE